MLVPRDYKLGLTHKFESTKIISVHKENIEFKREGKP